MDIRITNKHALVIGDEIIVDDFFVSARIETPHIVEVFDTEESKITFIASMQVGKFPVIPEIGEWCEGNKVYAYGDDKAKCIQGHYRTHYAIEDTPALWVIIPTVTQGYPAWVQPTGAHDSYQIGDRVSFNGNNYESTINANVWSPTAYPQGWKKI